MVELWIHTYFGGRAERFLWLDGMGEREKEESRTVPRLQPQKDGIVLTPDRRRV